MLAGVGQQRAGGEPAFHGHQAAPDGSALLPDLPRWAARFQAARGQGRVGPLSVPGTRRGDGDGWYRLVQTLGVRESAVGKRFTTRIERLQGSEGDRQAQ